MRIKVSFDVNCQFLPTFIVDTALCKQKIIYNWNMCLFYTDTIAEWRPAVLQCYTQVYTVLCSFCLWYVTICGEQNLTYDMFVKWYK